MKGMPGARIDRSGAPNITQLVGGRGDTTALRGNQIDFYDRGDENSGILSFTESE